MKKTCKWTEYAVEEKFSSEWIDTIHFETEEKAMEYVARGNKECGGEFYRYAGPVEKTKEVEIDETDWITKEWKWDKYHRAFE